MDQLPGRPFPLGATWKDGGANFAVFSEHAEAVELCLFDSASDSHENRRVRLKEQTNLIWHGFLPGVGPGQVYGYRVSAAFAPLGAVINEQFDWGSDRRPVHIRHLRYPLFASRWGVDD